MRRLVIRLVFRPPETLGRGYFAWTKERLETPKGPQAEAASADATARKATLSAVPPSCAFTVS